MSNKKDPIKKYKIVFVVLIVGAIVFLIFNSSLQNNQDIVLRPSLEPVAQWETYVDDDFKYKVDYPHTYGPHVDAQGGEVYAEFVSFEMGTDPVGILFTITVRSNTLQEELEFLKTWVTQNLSLVLESEEEVEASGVGGTKIIYKDESDDTNKPTAYAIFERGDYSYTISTRTETIDQILSTFEFLKNDK